MSADERSVDSPVMLKLEVYDSESERKQLEDDIYKMRCLLQDEEQESDEDDDDTQEDEQTDDAYPVHRGERTEMEYGNSTTDSLGVSSGSGPLPMFGEADPMASSEDIFNSLFANLPPSPELCLKVNLAYQQMIQETIEQTELMLERNRDQQRLTQETIATLNTQKRQNLYRRRAKAYTVFSYPYFQDLKGSTPPLNEDAKQRQCNFPDPYLNLPKMWSAGEKKELTLAVIDDAKKVMMQPLMIRKEYLCERLRGSLNASQEKDTQERIKQVEEEIEAINQLSTFELLKQAELKLDWLAISAVHMEGTRSVESCELMWKNFLNPSISKKKWTHAEDERLLVIAKKWRLRCWDNIARELQTNRTAFQCIERFQGYLNEHHVKGPWTPEEDTVLFKVIESCRMGNYIPWQKVAYYMEGRSRQQIYSHYMYHVQPSVKHGRFSTREDLILLASVQKYGKDFGKAAKFLPGRTALQCRGRYENSLGKEIKLGQWSKEEDSLLIKLTKKHGIGKWAKIAKEMPGRKAGMVTHRFHVIYRNMLLTSMKNEGLDMGISVHGVSIFDVDLDEMEKFVHNFKIKTRYAPRILDKRRKLCDLLERHVRTDQADPESMVNLPFNTKLDHLLSASEAIVAKNSMKHVTILGRKKNSLSMRRVDAALDEIFMPTTVNSALTKKVNVDRKLPEQQEHTALNFHLHQVLQTSAKTVLEEDMEFFDTTTFNNVENYLEAYVFGRRLSLKDLQLFPPNVNSLHGLKMMLATAKQLMSTARLVPKESVVTSLMTALDESEVLCASCIASQNRAKQSDDCAGPDTSETEVQPLSVIIKTENCNSWSMTEDHGRDVSDDNSTSVQKDGSQLPGNDNAQFLPRKRSLRRASGETLNECLTKRPRLEAEGESQGASSGRSFPDLSRYGSCYECSRLRHFRKEYQKLKTRFYSVFYWPALSPKVCNSNKQVPENSPVPEKFGPSQPKPAPKPFYMRARKLKKPWVKETMKKRFPMFYEKKAAQGVADEPVIKKRRNRKRKEKKEIDPSQLRRSSRQRKEFLDST